MQDETFEEFLQNTTETVELLHSPGLTIHSEKSGKAYKKINISKIWPEFQNYDSQTERYQEKKDYIRWEHHKQVMPYKQRTSSIYK